MERLTNTVLLLCLCASGAVSVKARQAVDTSPALHRFTIEKPRAAPAPSAPGAIPAPSAGIAPPGSRLGGTIGLGYVQGADWAASLRTTGTFAGIHVNAHALTTVSSRRTILEQGRLTLAAKSGRWGVEAGDVFSSLAGVGRGTRVAWTARGGRRPSLLLSRPHRLLEDRPTLVTYRDSFRFGAIGIVDGELASDGSHLLAVRLTPGAGGRFSVEAANRHRRQPETRDDRFSASVTTWRNIRVRTGVALATRNGRRSSWRTVGVHVPLGPVELAVERSFSADGPVRQTSSALTGSGSIGALRFFHRQQWGALDYQSADISFLQDTRHLQSMTTYGLGPRLSLTLQLATQWSTNGRLSTWEELLIAWRPTRSTSVRIAGAVPDLLSRDRARFRVTQGLPGPFTLELDYGHIAPYQLGTRVDDRPKARAMLLYQFVASTLAGRPAVQGQVVDHAGRPVAGAMVRLGPYAVATGPAGRFRFDNVPGGQFEVSLDESRLPAHQAWDGRSQRVSTLGSASRDVVLRVAPLGTFSGRVCVDRNGNTRCEDNEGISGVAIELDTGQATTSDHSGLYGFYNLPPGRYEARIAPAALTTKLAADRPSRTATLGPGRPVAGEDFVLRERERAILWNTLR